MGPRATVLTGLAAGAGVALALVVGAVLLVPEPAGDVAATPTPTTAAAPPSESGAATPDGSSGPQPSVRASIGTTAFHVGSPAPALDLPQLGGGRIDLAGLKGRPVWVNFMQTICPPCVDEFPLMNGFAVRYADTGLVVIAVDVREDEGTVADFVRSLNAQFPVGLDSNGAAAADWDAVALPIHFWIDRDGIIRAGALGGIGPDVMATNLGTILPGVSVTP
jgi:thiol-disulfide isomerase/thioredoxin